MSVAGMIAMQVATACVTEPKKEIDAYENAFDICKQLPIVQKQIDDIIDLRTKIAASKMVEADTQQKILELNTEISARINSISEMKKKFKIRIFINIISNIVLVAFIAVFLFS